MKNTLLNLGLTIYVWLRPLHRFTVSTYAFIILLAGKDKWYPTVNHWKLETQSGTVEIAHYANILCLQTTTFEYWFPRWIQCLARVAIWQYGLRVDLLNYYKVRYVTFIIPPKESDAADEDSYLAQFINPPYPAGHYTIAYDMANKQYTIGGATYEAHDVLLI